MAPKTRERKGVRAKLTLSPTPSTQTESPHKSTTVHEEGSTAGQTTPATKIETQLGKATTSKPAAEPSAAAQKEPSMSPVSSKGIEETRDSPVKNLVNEPKIEAASETSTIPAQKTTLAVTPEQSSSANPETGDIPPPKVVKREQKAVKKRTRKDPSPTLSTTGKDEFEEEGTTEEDDADQSSGESKDQKGEEVDILCLEGTEVDPTPIVSARKGKVVVGT